MPESNSPSKDEFFNLPASFPRTFADYEDSQPPHELKPFLPGFQLGRGLETINNDERPLVLLTGGTGFIGSHTALLLVFLGYRVRCAVRKKESKWSKWLLGLNTPEGLANAIEVSREKVKSPLPSNPGIVELIECSLGSEKNWDKACEGVDSLIHCAQKTRGTAIGKGAVETEEEFNDALSGLLIILANCKRCGVRRMIYVSSMLACDEDSLSTPPVTPQTRLMPCDASKWTPAKQARETGMHPYLISKVFTEMAFWRFAREFEGTFDAVCIAPGMTMGPAINGRIVSSYDPLLFFSTMNVPCPPIDVEVVDVRDVATSLVAAIQKPASVVHGKRYMVCASVISPVTMAQYAYEFCHRNNCTQYTSEYSIGEMPTAMGAVLNLVVPDFKEGVWTQWNSKRFFSNIKSQLDLGLVYLQPGPMLEDTLTNLLYFDIWPEPQNRFLPSPFALKLSTLMLTAGLGAKMVSKL